MSTPVVVVPYPDPVEGKYIVVLKDGTQGSDYSYGDITSWDHVLNGFCATLSQAELDDLCVSSNVEAIYQDGYAKIATVNDNVPTLTAQEVSALRASMDASLVSSGPGSLANNSQTDATWGLQRIIQPGKLANQNDRASNFNYNWNQVAGRGVDVYVVDTGIDINHPQFEQRATWGTTFGGHPDVDDNGHGTHCAGTIGSRHFGVSKQVNLVAVKVLDKEGSGQISDIISGMNWVSQTAANTDRPSIVSMSLGGSVSSPLDRAVANLTSRGVHVVVAAGNENEDARKSSPARAPSANTVGSSSINDSRSSFSNYGSLLALFAPGENIISTWNTEPGVFNLSGTSMACPHVAGALALLISISGNDTPAVWRAKLKSLAAKNALTDLRTGSPNLLLQATSA